MEHEVRFLGPAGSRVLSLASTPASGSGAGLLICSSVQAEFTRNYRREHLLARALAERGITVQRFQYRGSGNSDGRSSETTLDSMIEDARSALDHLLAQPHVARVAVLGTRLGGLVAAAVASGLDDAPVALWQPVTDPERYLREVLRARLMSELRAGAATGRTADDLLEELRSTGAVDVLGYSLDLALVQSLEGRTLDAALAGARRPLLMVQFSRRKELRPDLRQLVLTRSQAGWPVTTWVFPVDEPWWFTDDVFDRTVAGARPIVDFTASWVAERIASVGVAS